MSVALHSLMTVPGGDFPWWWPPAWKQMDYPARHQGGGVKASYLKNLHIAGNGRDAGPGVFLSDGPDSPGGGSFTSVSSSVPGFRTRNATFLPASAGQKIPTIAGGQIDRSSVPGGSSFISPDPRFGREKAADTVLADIRKKGPADHQLPLPHDFPGIHQEPGQKPLAGDTISAVSPKGDSSNLSVRGILNFIGGAGNRDTIRAGMATIFGGSPTAQKLSRDGGNHGSSGLHRESGPEKSAHEGLFLMGKDTQSLHASISFDPLSKEDTGKGAAPPDMQHLGDLDKKAHELLAKNPFSPTPEGGQRLDPGKNPASGANILEVVDHQGHRLILDLAHHTGVSPALEAEGRSQASIFQSEVLGAPSVPGGEFTHQKDNTRISFLDDHHLRHLPNSWFGH